MSDLAAVSIGLNSDEWTLLALICEGLALSFEAIRERLSVRTVAKALYWSIRLQVLRSAGLVEFDRYNCPIRATPEGRAAVRAWRGRARNEVHH